jgi:hypothetical protein
MVVVAPEAITEMNQVSLMALLILAGGGTAFGLGIGIIIGYWLGRRSRGREQQAGFPVEPRGANIPRA